MKTTNQNFISIQNTQITTLDQNHNEENRSTLGGHKTRENHACTEATLGFN